MCLKELVLSDTEKPCFGHLLSVFTSEGGSTFCIDTVCVYIQVLWVIGRQSLSIPGVMGHWETELVYPRCYGSLGDRACLSQVL